MRVQTRAVTLSVVLPALLLLCCAQQPREEKAGAPAATGEEARLERGEVGPSLDMAMRLSDFLGCSIDDLLRRGRK